METKPLSQRFIKLDAAELQSGMDRIVYAEGLILQLPKTHEGRNTWLLNYGKGEEAQSLRKKHNVKFMNETRSSELCSR
ncbi:MAG: hypothetical protein CL843_19670 [Crocinitomicaceae bacterium]|nr:hypothetical protein [Crocinitomicaceae bacterium]